MLRSLAVILVSLGTLCAGQSPGGSRQRDDAMQQVWTARRVRAVRRELIDLEHRLLSLLDGPSGATLRRGLSELPRGPGYAGLSLRALLRIVSGVGW